MRKFLRNMAKAKMKEMGYSKINKRMDRGRWREIVGAYPVNLFTGKKDVQELPRPQAEQAGLLRLPLRVLSYDSLRSPIPAIQRRNRVGSGL